MRKAILAVVGILCVIFSGCLVNIPEKTKQNDVIFTSAEVPLTRFSSYEELKNFLNSTKTRYGYGDAEAKLGVDAVGGSRPEHSKTNVQVKGVDEADIVKTDGKYIYVISGGNVILVKAWPPEEARILSQIELSGTPIEMFINQDKLVIFESQWGAYDTWGIHGPEGYVEDFPYAQPRAFIKVYDVSDREKPILKINVSLDGSYFDSRMIGEYVYVVIQSYIYYKKDEIILPVLLSGKRAEVIPASAIYYWNFIDYSYTFTTILAINLRDGVQELAYKTFLLGSASGMYVSLDNIYLTVGDWCRSRWSWEDAKERTLLYRIHLVREKLKCVASGEVPGRVLNQFSMDEFNSYFRIATTTGWWENSQNHIYVLDLNLNVVGNLSDIAPGERIYSARFMGDRCYLVTFREVDPFFVIDMRYPSKPKVLGELKIPGFSSYLHPYDKNHIIGIGKEGGNVKISFFDVSNVNYPKEKARYLVEGLWSYSPVLYDHKAFLLAKSKNVLVIPVSVDTKAYNREWHRWQGAYVFDISVEKGLALKGKITHLENNTTDRYWYHHSSYVKRSLYIDDVLYTISDKKIKMNSIENLAEVCEIELRGE